MLQAATLAGVSLLPLHVHNTTRGVDAELHKQRLNGSIHLVNATIGIALLRVPVVFANAANFFHHLEYGFMNHSLTRLSGQFITHLAFLVLGTMLPWPHSRERSIPKASLSPRITPWHNRRTALPCWLPRSNPLWKRHLR